MPLHTDEFYCSGGCGWYNYPRLNLEIEGEFTIKCGHCDHPHYRYIKKGEIHDPTADDEDFQRRITERRGGEYGQVIKIMPSACQKERRKFGKVAKIKQELAAAQPKLSLVKRARKKMGI